MEMASWFDTKDGFIFLTDDDVRAWHENLDEARSINWNDFVGHGGIVKVFGIPDVHKHHEGFVGMPTVIKKCILDGKMDVLFAHATNLQEATPEFIPLMKRLANKYTSVAAYLKSNPYAGASSTRSITIESQMEMGVKNNFQGSTIGNLIRDPGCTEKAFMMALEGAQPLMDMHRDHHHYWAIIDHLNVTKKVLKYILDNIKHKDVASAAKTRFDNFKPPVPIVIEPMKPVKMRIITKGGAKVRIAV